MAKSLLYVLYIMAEKDILTDFWSKNFKIYSGLKPSLAKKALTFVGHDNGVSQTYCVRLPGEEQAQQLKEVLDQEIESVAIKDKE